MIFESDRGRRRHNIPFGGEVRGLNFDEVQLESIDLRRMLDMNDGVLKDHIHDLYCSMERNEREKRSRGSARDPRRPFESYRYDENPYEYRREQARRMEENLEARRAAFAKDSAGPSPIPSYNPTDFFTESEVPKSKRSKVLKTKPDKTGLVWVED